MKDLLISLASLPAALLVLRGFGHADDGIHAQKYQPGETVLVGDLCAADPLTISRAGAQAALDNGWARPAEAVAEGNPTEGLPQNPPPAPAGATSGPGEPSSASPAGPASMPEPAAPQNEVVDASDGDSSASPTPIVSLDATPSIPATEDGGKPTKASKPSRG